MKDLGLFSVGDVIRVGMPVDEQLKRDHDDVSLAKVVELKSGQLHQKKTKLSLRREQLRIESQSFSKVIVALSKLDSLESKLLRARNKLAPCGKHYSRCEQVCIKSRVKLGAAEAKLQKASTSGSLQRLFLGLNPAKCEAALDITRIKCEKANQRYADAEKVLHEKTLAVNQLLHQQAFVTQEVDSFLKGYGLQRAQLKERISTSRRQLAGIDGQIAAIEKQLEKIEIVVIQEAKVIASTLSKTVTSAVLASQKFNCVIIDEISAAPLPNVYYTLLCATQKAVIVGDFRQLPPISKLQMLARAFRRIRRIWQKNGWRQIYLNMSESQLR